MSYLQLFASAVVILAVGLPSSAIGEVETSPAETVVVETSSGATVECDKVEWDRIDIALVKTLLTQDLLALANSLANEPVPNRPAEILRRLDIFLRAGYRQHAGSMIDALAESTAPLDDYQLERIVHFLLTRQEWELGRQFAECFPRSTPGLAHELIRHWADSGGSPQVIDQWISARIEASAAFTIQQRLFWMGQRARFRTRLGTETELLEALAAEVKTHPEDLEKPYLYIEAICGVGKGPRPLDWLGKACSPALAIDCYELGSRLRGLEAWKGAQLLLERSLTLPITPKDIRKVGICQRPMTDEQYRSAIRFWTKSELLKCYQALGEGEKAQQLMEELVNSRACEGVLPPHLAYTAGTVQSLTGHRVIEERIQDKEAENKDTAKYWHSRASYYMGRGEEDEAITAFEKALKLLPVDGSPRGFKSSEPDRSSVLSRYWRYLADIGRKAEAAELLRDELVSVSPDMVMAETAVRALLNLHNDFHYPLNPDEALLWTFLEQREVWDHVEERLLLEMIRSTLADSRHTYWSRAEKLVHEADPSRAMHLGWVMLIMDEPERARPHLEDAVSRLQDAQMLMRTRSILLRVYFELEDWRAAESIFPQAQERLTAREIQERYARIALIAARDWAFDDAMRLWRRQANIDFADLESLKQVAKTDLRDRLRDFYLQAKQKAPASWVPEVALQILD